MAETTHQAPEMQSGMAAQEEGHHGVFPPLDSKTFPSQLLWLAIFFGLLYVLLSKYVLPHIGSIIERRNTKIEGDLATARQVQSQVAAAVATYEQALSTAKSSAQTIAQEARAKLNAELDAERARVDEELSAKLAKAEAAIQTAKNKAMADVAQVATETAQAIVEHLTGPGLGKASGSAALSRKG